MNVEVLPAAESELRDTARFYEERSAGLGDAFLTEFERACDSLVLHADLGMKIDHMHRRLMLRRFPFAIIYRVDDAGLRIVAVAHAHRRPGSWRPGVREIPALYAVKMAA